MNEWLIKHNHACVPADELPTSGFVVEDQGEQICMAFMRMVEGSVAIAESLVTDPNAPLCKRVKAVDQIIDKLVETAKARDIKYLLATTVSPGVMKRISRRHNFNKSDQVLYVKKL